MNSGALPIDRRAHTPRWHIRTYDEACCGTKVEYRRSSTPPHSYGLDLHYSTTAARHSGPHHPARARSDTGPRIRPCSPWSPLVICQIMRTPPGQPHGTPPPASAPRRPTQTVTSPTRHWSTQTKTQTKTQTNRPRQKPRGCMAARQPGVSPGGPTRNTLRDCGLQRRPVSAKPKLSRRASEGIGEAQ